MRQDDFPQTEELDGLQRQLTNAKKNLRAIQERKSEYALAEDIPLELVQNERRLETEITRLEKEIAAMIPAVETPKQPVAGNNTDGAAGQLARVTLTLEGDIRQFGEKEREAFIWNLSRLLDIPEEHIRILRVMEGSIKIELRLPEKAARRLEAMYQNNDPALEQLQAKVQGVQVETYEEVLIGILRKARILIRDLIRAIARDLTRVSDLNRGRTHALILASALDRALDLTSANPPTEATLPTSTRTRERARERARHHVPDLASALDLASGRASALASALNLGLTGALFNQLSTIADTELGPNHAEVNLFNEEVKRLQQSLQDGDYEESVEGETYYGEDIGYVVEGGIHVVEDEDNEDILSMFSSSREETGKKSGI